jgi:hypothetical protein
MRCFPIVLLAAAVTICDVAAQDAPDISSVAADLKIPALHPGPPAAGRRCLQATTGWENTDVRFALYLPVNWDRANKHPVIIEFAGNGNYKNSFGDVSTGRVEGSSMGYGISGGKDFLWVCMPYLDAAGKKPVITWWGDPPTYAKAPTIDHCIKAVREVCARWNGDTERVLLVGFSRGAIACSAIGLANEEIAGLWRGLVAYSHYHGVNESWPFEGARRDAALEHLKRLKGRPQFICGESKAVLDKTRAFLTDAGAIQHATIRHTGFRNHSDAWLLRPSEARDELRAWVAKVMK